jgi:hypothetical protein
LWLFCDCDNNHRRPSTTIDHRPQITTHRRHQRYRQDSGGLQARVRALYEAVADEDASETDIRRQQMHERSAAVFAGVKRLQDRVRKAQAAYRSAGISLAASGGSAGVAEEGLSELRTQVRKLSGRLHRLRYHVEEEEEQERARRGGGGHEEAVHGSDGDDDDDEEEEEEGPPLTMQS